MSNWSTNPAITKLQDSSVCVVGLAREGLSTYRFLRSVFPDKQLALADQQELTALDPAWSVIASEDSHLTWHFGGEYLLCLQQYNYLFLTPGIRTDQPAIAAALAQDSQLHSNTQLFFELCPCPIIGITGTKGKSTTTSLIHHVLATAGKSAVLLGNIGIPPLAGLEKLTPESLSIVELSCHQLQHLPYSPHVAIIQNITAEHLDYYPTIEAYVKAKSSIASHQTADDVVMFNSDFARPREIANLGQAEQQTFSLTNHDQGQTVWLENDRLIWNNQQIIAVHEIPLAGEHNLLNVIPSIMVSKYYGLTNQQIADGIKSFRSLPHRLELVVEKEGVRYYNDSLATEPHATINAIAAFPNQPIILLAGGYERHQDYRELAVEIVTANIKALILFPTTGERLWQNVQAATAELNEPMPIVHFVDTMTEAMNVAKQHTRTGDLVLLSPAAASFGVFKDYRDRGEQFAQLAKNS